MTSEDRDPLLSTEEVARMMISRRTNKPIKPETVRRMIREGHIRPDKDHSLTRADGETLVYMVRRSEVIRAISRWPGHTGAHSWPEVTDPRTKRRWRRRDLILEIMREARDTDAGVSVSDVAEEVGCSDMTARRAVAALRKSGLVKRVGWGLYQAT